MCPPPLHHGGRVRGILKYWNIGCYFVGEQVNDKTIPPVIGEQVNNRTIAPVFGKRANINLKPTQYLEAFNFMCTLQQQQKEL
jgi:hypothetical protein